MEIHGTRRLYLANKGQNVLRAGNWGMHDATLQTKTDGDGPAGREAVSE